MDLKRTLIGWAAREWVLTNNKPISSQYDDKKGDLEIFKKVLKAA